MNRGKWVFIVGAAIVAIMLIVGYFYTNEGGRPQFSTSAPSNVSPSASITPSSSPRAPQAPAAVPSANIATHDTITWKTYTDARYSLSVEYPCDQFCSGSSPPSMVPGTFMDLPTQDDSTSVGISAYSDQNTDSDYSVAYSTASMHAALTSPVGAACELSYWESRTATTSCEISMLGGQKAIKLYDTGRTYPDITFFVYRNGTWIEIMEMFQSVDQSDMDTQYFDGELQPPPDLQKGISAAAEVVRTLSFPDHS